jgi:hypothetical protein
MYLAWIAVAIVMLGFLLTCHVAVQVADKLALRLVVAMVVMFIGIYLSLHFAFNDGLRKAGYVGSVDILGNGDQFELLQSFTSGPNFTGYYIVGYHKNKILLLYLPGSFEEPCPGIKTVEKDKGIVRLVGPCKT